MSLKQLAEAWVEAAADDTQAQHTGGSKDWAETAATLASAKWEFEKSLMLNDAEIAEMRAVIIASTNEIMQLRDKVKALERTIGELMRQRAGL